MSYFKLILKANQLDYKKKLLENEKKHSVKIHYGLEPKLTLHEKCNHKWIDCKKKMKRLICSCMYTSKNTLCRRLYYNIKTDGTFENYILKSITGFMGGIFLTYIFFMFFIFQLNFKLSTATIMCSTLGSILTIGLAFSQKVRCVVFLILPHFFSTRGRQVLMAYAFILALTGPAKNILNNMGILSESLACGEAQLKDAVKQILDVVKKPFYAIKDAVKSIIITLKYIVKQIKKIFLTIKRIVMAIANFLKSAFQWLSNIINICNKELGTPFQRCMRVMDNAIVDCNAKLGPMFSWLCSATYVAKGLCYLVKWMDFICMLLDFVNDSVVGVIIKKINIFMRHIRAIFYIKVKFSHSFKFQTSQSKSMTEVTHGIITEIGERIENLLTVFDLMSSLTSLFFLFIFFKVLYYRYNFLTNETFDNHFITKYLHEIDMNRAKLEKETIFPLNQREKQQYIQLSSLRLLKEERTSLSKSAIILSIAILKLCIHMMADYCLYWMLAMIRRIGGYQTSIETPNTVTLHVEGNGFLADLYRSIIKAFQPVGVKIDFDTVPCLPDPIPPDYDRYFQIVSLVILCWILAICEPYGLRLRYSVMSYYHPDRAKHRSVWLYNHILRRRMNFLQFARRKLRQKFKNTSKDTEHITWSDYLKEHVNNKCVRYLFGIETNKACIVCGTVQTEKNRNNFIQCMKPNCVGFYCFDCYKDLGNMCTICMEPTDYGDFSDFSEEVDSSDDENSKKLQTLYKMRKYTASKQINLDDSNKNHNTENYEHESDKSDSSNYSYSYQSDKNTSQPTIVSRTSFVDLEKQIIPDYASMESYKKSSLTNTSLSNISSLEYSDIENKNEDVLKTPRLKTIFRKNKPTLESDSSTLSASEEDERRQTQPFLKRNPRINKRSNKYKSEQKTSNFILKRIVNIVDNFKKYFFKHKKHTNVSPSNIHKINKLYKLNASKNWDSDNDLSDNTRAHLSEYNSSKKYSDTEGSLTSRDNLLTKSSRFESHSDSNKDLKNYHNRDNVLLRDVHYEVVDEQSPRFARRQLSNKKCYISKCCNQAVKDKYTEPLNYMSPDSDIELTDRSKSERYYDDSDSLNNSNTLTTVNVKESHRHSIPSTYSNKNLKFNTSSSYLSDLNIDGSDLSTLNTSRRNSSTQATSADLKNKESKDCNGTNTDYDTFSEFKLIDLNDSSNISNDIKNSSRSNGSRKSVLRSKRKNN